jgi:hypothetical protein
MGLPLRRSFFAAMPKSEISTSKRKFGSTTLTPDEAREVGSEKRAEIAKAQAEAKVEAEANRESGVDKIATKFLTPA